MSIEAMTWALNVPLGGNQKVLLLGIANHAHPDGTEAYPSLDTLAAYAHCDRSTARRNVRKLIEEGWVIEDGLGPKGQVKYRLPLGVANREGLQNATGGAGARGGVANRGGGGGVAVPPEPSIEPSVNRPSQQQPIARASEPWPGVSDEMRADADELLRLKQKVGERIVTAREVEIAAVALSEFNRQADSDFGLGAHIKPIVGRIRERPSADAVQHVRLVQSAWRLRWWEKRDSRRRPTPQVVYGNARVFEQVWQDAVAEAKGQRVEGPSRSSMFAGRTFIGRSWEELTRREQENVREAASMGLEVWDGGKDAWQDRELVAVAPTNGNGHGVTADNFLDDD